jgi:hypothetical protein
MSGGHLVARRQLAVETLVVSCRHILRGCPLHREDVYIPTCAASGQEASFSFSWCIPVPWFLFWTSGVCASSLYHPPYQPQGFFDFCLKCFFFYFSVKRSGIHYCVARTSESSEVSSNLRNRRYCVWNCLWGNVTTCVCSLAEVLCVKWHVRRGDSGSPRVLKVESASFVMTSERSNDCIITMKPPRSFSYGLRLHCRRPCIRNV